MPLESKPLRSDSGSYDVWGLFGSMRAACALIDRAYVGRGGA